MENVSEGLNPPLTVSDYISHIYTYIYSTTVASSLRCAPQHKPSHRHIIHFLPFHLLAYIPKIPNSFHPIPTHITTTYPPTASLILSIYQPETEKMDAFTPQQTTELVSRIGCKKASMRWDILVVNSFMAGPLLGFGYVL